MLWLGHTSSMSTADTQVDANSASSSFLTHIPSTEFSVFTVQFLMTFIFAGFAYDAAPLNLIIAWSFAWLAITFARLFVYRKVISNKSIDITKKENLALGLNLLFGLMQALSVYFFQYFSFTERVAYTLIMLGTISGSVTIIGYRKMFLIFTVPLVSALSIGWLVLPIPEEPFALQFVIAVLILFYFRVLLQNSVGYNELYKEAIDSRERQKNLNKKLHIALNDAQKANDSKTRFLASASHDLRQPIHTLSLLNAALQVRNLDEQSTIIVERIGKATDILAMQMSSLLDVSKLDAGLIEPEKGIIDLKKFVDRLNSEYQEPCSSKGLALKTNFEATEAMTEADAIMLDRVVRNLISNAIRYTEKGSITISVLDDDVSWVLSVKDTGIGLSDENKEKVFEEFYQVHNSNRKIEAGLGLGLSIAQRICTLMGIELKVKSMLGTGSEFFISLPKSAVTTNASKQSQTNSILHSIHGKKVLCIDDEPDILFAMKLMMNELGCSFTGVAGTADALTYVEQNKPDIVLADFRLADDDNGIKAIKAIRNIYPELPALLISGDTAPERLLEAKHARLELIHKPIDIRYLQSRLSELTK